MPPCLPNAESQGLEGFEAFNPGIQERGKRKQSKECWWKLPSMQQGKPMGRRVSAGQRSSLATLKGTLQVITCELCRIKGKHECCKSYYTAALCFDIAIKVMPTALNFESHSICFRSQKDLQRATSLFNQSFAWGFRRMEHKHIRQNFTQQVRVVLLTRWKRNSAGMQKPCITKLTPLLYRRIQIIL